jgi:addiction module HigA family antidote
MTIRIEDVSRMDFSDVATTGRLRPVSPGDILLHDFIEPMNLSANALAKALGVPANRITGIIKGTRGISADTAYRLSIAFNTTPEFWMNLQTQYELEIMQKTAEQIAEEVHRLAA